MKTGKAHKKKNKKVNNGKNRSNLGEGSEVKVLSSGKFAIMTVVMPFGGGVTQPLQRVVEALNIRVVGKPANWK